MVVVAVAASQAAAQNLLANPGFEDPVAEGPEPFSGRWQPFNGGAGTFSVGDGLMPKTGAGDLHLGITATNNSFAGAFQDVLGLSPGNIVNLGGWHKSASDPTGYVSELRIEWRNATTEISRTPNQNFVPTAVYSPFTQVYTVPAGTTIARVVYAIQTFSDVGTTNTADVFLDDMILTRIGGIPEPATIALAGLAGLVLVTARRRLK
jgi:hypothetical protein